MKAKKKAPKVMKAWAILSTGDDPLCDGFRLCRARVEARYIAKLWPSRWRYARVEIREVGR